MAEISVKAMEEAFQDQAFEEKVLNCESKAELKELFASKGIEMSDEEIKQMVDHVNSLLADGDELSEDSLDQVSGGIGIAAAGAILGGAYVAGRLYARYAKGRMGWCGR